MISSDAARLRQSLTSRSTLEKSSDRELAGRAVCAAAICDAGSLTQGLGYSRLTLKLHRFNIRIQNVGYLCNEVLIRATPPRKISTESPRCTFVGTTKRALKLSDLRRSLQNSSRENRREASAILASRPRLNGGLLFHISPVT